MVVVGATVVVVVVVATVVVVVVVATVVVVVVVGATVVVEVGATVVVVGATVVVVVGAIVSLTSDAAPSPSAVRAVTRKRYVMPFVKPLTVAEVSVDVPSLTVVQLTPSVETSMT